MVIFPYRCESDEADRGITHQPKSTVILLGDNYPYYPPLHLHILCVKNTWILDKRYLKKNYIFYLFIK